MPKRQSLPNDVDWNMTAHALNALPFAVRNYIHLLEDKRDPEGVVRELMILQQHNKELRLKNAALEAENKIIKENFGSNIGSHL